MAARMLAELAREHFVERPGGAPVQASQQPPRDAAGVVHWRVNIRELCIRRRLSLHVRRGSAHVLRLAWVGWASRADARRMTRVEKLHEFRAGQRAAASLLWVHFIWSAWGAHAQRARCTARAVTTAAVCTGRGRDREGSRDWLTATWFAWRWRAAATAAAGAKARASLGAVGRRTAVKNATALLAALAWRLWWQEVHAGRQHRVLVAHARKWSYEASASCTAGVLRSLFYVWGQRAASRRRLGRQANTLAELRATATRRCLAEAAFQCW